MSKNPDESTVSDEADGIISVMATKGYSLDEIVSFLESSIKRQYNLDT